MIPIFVNPKMNKTEARYCQRLELLKRADEIVDYCFEGITFKLADDTRYTPDFLVVLKDRFECHEVKGFIREDSFIKFKIAIKLFQWFRFRLIFWNNRIQGFEEKVIDKREEIKCGCYRNFEVI